MLKATKKFPKGFASAPERYPIGLRNLSVSSSHQDIEHVVIQIWRAARNNIENKKPLNGQAPDGYQWEELLIFMERQGFNTDEKARNGTQLPFFLFNIDELKQAHQQLCKKKKTGACRDRASCRRIQELQNSLQPVKQAELQTPAAQLAPIVAA
ncbi:MAG: hypothetical protein L6Q57_06800 [Alphaproteobacteria bacterium]|nr:hypothetical protein [Alphaproteobacteria bacterium]